MPWQTPYPDGAVPIKGELVSADASTAVALTLYTNYDSLAFTIGSTQQFYITAICIVTASALTIDLFDDVATSGTVNSGERILGGAFAPNGGCLVPFTFPIPCKIGSTPKVKASAAGSIQVVVHGYAK